MLIMPFVFPRPILNNGYTFYYGGSPFKSNTMEQGSDIINSKHGFVGHYIKNSVGDSSDVIAKKRRLAVGKNFGRQGVLQGAPSSYASSNNNDVKHTLSKARSGGYVSPPKKNMIK
jgi:hypothetical protein